MSYESVVEKNNQLITIVRYRDGFEEGYIQNKESSGKWSEEKWPFVRNIDPIWFSENPHRIMKILGIETTVQRANSLADLFDGTLDGFYYVSIASGNNDEAAKIILGYISETFKNRNINIKDINRYIPAVWLKELINSISSNKVDKKFLKNFIDEFIDEENKNIDISEFITEKMKLPKYQVMDNSLVYDFVNTVFENNKKAVMDAVENPKKAGFLTGQVMKLSGGKASPQDVAKIITEKLKEIKIS